MQEVHVAALRSVHVTRFGLMTTVEMVLGR